MSEEIFIVDDNILREKVYIIRGQQVMLSFDLAEIYGYEHKRFMEQVRNNKEKFDDDFMFQLSKDEYDSLKSKISSSSWGGRRKLPFAFTEQGIYMLMTVLRGKLATMQSKALIRLFKGMKDYIIADQQFLITKKDYTALMRKIDSNADDILKIKKVLGTVVTKTDLSEIKKLFESARKTEEILILNGEPFKADLAYQKIYSEAKKSVIVIDDYIGVKTLQHMVHAPANVTFTVISDNKGSRPLRLSEYNDFISEYPGRSVSFLQSCGRAHDRYIVLDEGTRSMKVFHCGASSKDAGKRITTITRIGDVNEYKGLVKELNGNPGLVLS